MFCKSKKFFVALLFIFMVGLPNMAVAAEKSKDPVRLVYVEWPCAAISTNIAKVVIEDRLDRKADMVPVSAAIMFQALSTNEADATVTAWLPETHDMYFKRLQKNLEDLGPITGGAKLGLVVPDYVDITKIEELEKNKDQFESKIYGIDPGAGIMILAEDAVDKYGLRSFDIIESSDGVMVSALADAIRNKKPIVVTGWVPHWMFGAWDLHFLDDPKKAFGEEESIHAVVRKGLDKDMPDVVAFLKNFKYENVNQLQKLMAEVTEKDRTPYEVAQDFVKNNPELVDSWFK